MRASEAPPAGQAREREPAASRRRTRACMEEDRWRKSDGASRATRAGPV